MKKFGVYQYKTNKFLGDFLNITEDNHTVRVWYLSKEGNLTGAYREGLVIKAIPDHGMC